MAASEQEQAFHSWYLPSSVEPITGKCDQSGTDSSGKQVCSLQNFDNDNIFITITLALVLAELSEPRKRGHRLTRASLQLTR